MSINCIKKLKAHIASCKQRFARFYLMHGCRDYTMTSLEAFKVHWQNVSGGYIGKHKNDV